MALIEPPYSKISENSKNLSEIQNQQKQENLGFIPIVHVKDVYKSFDFKNNRNNNSNSNSNTTTYDHLSGEQQQQLKSKSSLRTSSSYEVLNGVDLKIKEGEFVTIVGP